MAGVHLDFFHATYSGAQNIVKKRYVYEVYILFELTYVVVGVLYLSKLELPAISVGPGKSDLALLLKAFWSFYGCICIV